MRMTPKSTTQEEDVVDPLEEMLKKTGCMELHYQVQECIVESQDWRKCQKEVQKFKECMNEYQTRKEASLNK